MGDALNRLRAAYGYDTAALSGTSHVEGYTRHTKSGKSVHVDAYTRTLAKMSVEDLRHEYAATEKSGDRAKSAQVLNEMRRRTGSTADPRKDKQAADDLIHRHRLSGVNGHDDQAYDRVSKAAREANLSWNQMTDIMDDHNNDEHRRKMSRTRSHVESLPADTSPEERAHAAIRNFDLGYYKGGAEAQRKWAKRIAESGQDPLDWLRKHGKGYTLDAGF